MTQDQTYIVVEQAFPHSEAELGAFPGTVSDATIVVDGSDRIGAFNDAAQNLLGYDRSSVIGRPIDPLIDGDWPALVSAAEKHGGIHAMRMITAKGERLSVEWRIGSLRVKKSSGYVLFLSDISERRATDARRNLFERTARDIAIAEFAAHLTHELNQPLTAASNFLAIAQHFAREPAKVTETGQMIDMALSQIQRLGGIIRSTHLKAAGQDFDPRSVSVRTAIEEVVTLVHTARSDRSVSVKVDVMPGAETMCADPVGIQQVLANLLRNAIEAFGDAPRDGAQIVVTSRQTGNRLALSVLDNGPGISPALMHDLFEPFGRRDKQGGMGLGLSICRTIAEAHGGTLTAENPPEGGACFVLTLAHEREEMA